MNWKRIKNSITIIAVITVLAACEKDKLTSEPQEIYSCPYNMDQYSVVFPDVYSESDGIIPMNMNNYWRYADSTWDESGNLTQVDEFLMEVTEVGVLNQEAWWRTTFSPLRIFHQSDEGISDLQTSLSGCNFKADVYRIFTGDTLDTSVSIFGDVLTEMIAYKMNTFDTPVGSFTDCIFYHKINYDQTVLKPGIGILEWKTGFESGSLAGRKFTLMEYYIE